MQSLYPIGREVLLGRERPNVVDYAGSCAATSGAKAPEAPPEERRPGRGLLEDGVRVDRNGRVSLKAINKRHSSFQGRRQLGRRARGHHHTGHVCIPPVRAVEVVPPEAGPEQLGRLRHADGRLHVRSRGVEMAVDPLRT